MNEVFMACYDWRSEVFGAGADKRLSDEVIGQVFVTASFQRQIVSARTIYDIELGLVELSRNWQPLPKFLDEAPREMYGLNFVARRFTKQNCFLEVSCW